MTQPVRHKAMEGTIRVGDTWITRRTFTEKETMTFGDLIRDYNPVHYEERFSAVKGFSDRILHGLLTASMICEPGGQSALLAKSMNFNFLKPVYFGDTIECRLTIASIDDRGMATAKATYINQHGEMVLEAELTGILPGEEERKVLSEMIAEGDPTNKLKTEG